MDNKAIIEEIRSGNKDSIKTVYQSYAKDIYNFSKSITGDHDKAMDATKKTFIELFTNIQNGDTPEDIRLAALKIAYEESCSIVMPGAIKQPSDDGKVVGDDIIDTPEEFQSVMEESDQETDTDSWKDEPNEAEFPDQMIQSAVGDSPAEELSDTEETVDVSNTQVFSINAMDYNQDGELVIDEKEEIDNKDIPEIELGDEEDVIEEPVKPRRKGVTAIIVIINIILILILLWLLYGLLINFGVLPQIADLGYTWFNNTIYPIF